MASKEKKGAKFGRTANRPSQKVYVMTKRSEINKAKRIARHEKRMAAKSGLSVAQWRAKCGGRHLSYSA